VTNESERYLVISTDGHAGADLLDYKPYLEKSYHEEFDAWAATYHDAWGELDDTSPVNRRIGWASFAAPLNWDSKARLLHTEEQGIAAEVLFPNTSPPFYPSGAVSAPGPLNQEEYEHRMAGLRAHNRWLVDFCNDAPGRRAGLAQVLLNDVDAAVAEAKWAKEAGLMGILLPADHVLKMVNLYYPEYEPFWAACADLDLPLHRHGVKATEIAAVGGKASPYIGSIEADFYAARAFVHLILAGVFERYPSLKLATTEPMQAVELFFYLAKLDKMTENVRSRGHVTAAGALSNLRRKPSEYFATNCFVGGPLDLRKAYDAGVPNLMWGADLPHAEGTSPYSLEAQRAVFAGIPEDDTRKMLSENALKVYGFDAKLLRSVADRVGPTVAQLAEPLRPEEIPSYPQDSRCGTFAELAGLPVLDMAME
jgi:predicted TIM-barrel fold metal-dependent hydrolase